VGGRHCTGLNRRVSQPTKSVLCLWRRLLIQHRPRVPLSPTHDMILVAPMSLAVSILSRSLLEPGLMASVAAMAAMVVHVATGSNFRFFPSSS
jgi:hypothetical protein